MKKNRAGIITAAVLITLILIGVLADYIIDLNKYPTYKHGQITSVTLIVRGGIDGRNYEYTAYKDGDDYMFEYNNKRAYTKEVFELSERDYKKLIRNDFNELINRKPQPRPYACDDIYVYTILGFEDGFAKEIQGTDYSISTYFQACEETFLKS